MQPQGGQVARTGVFRRLFGQRELADAPLGQAFVLAVTSGKGGTGKSFVASNLAIALHQRGRVTTLVDCDFGLGNAHLLLGVNPKRTMQHVVAGQASVRDVRCQTPHGPTLVPAGSGISRLAELSEHDLLHLAQGFAQLGEEADALVLDTAAGISPQSVLTLLLADHIVLVTNPEIAALTDAYALVKCVARQPRAPQVSVVVNRVPRPGFGRATFDKLRDVAARFAGCELAYLGELPEDPAVTQRRLGQPPLLVADGGCATSQRLQLLAERLVQRCGGVRRRDVLPHDAIVQRLRSRLAP